MPIPVEDWFGPSESNRVRTTGFAGMPVEEFFSAAMPMAPVEATTPQQTPGFVTSIKRSTNSIASDYANAGQLFFSTVADIPSAANYFAEKAQSYKVAAEQYPREVPRIEDIHGPGDFGTWAIEQAGELVPVLAAFMVPGGVVGKGVSLAGKGAAAAKYAGLTAGFLSDLGMMTGESVGIAKENDQPIDDLRVVGSGLGKAVLDFIPFFAAAKQLGIAGPIERAILKHAVDAGYWKRAAGNAAVIMASEVPTETMQEWINVELDNYFTGYDGPMTEDQKSQLYNAAAAATLFGGLGLYAPKTPPPPSMTETDEAINARDQALGPVDPTIGPPSPVTGRFTDIPVSGEANGFDFRNLYDKKTGELRTTAADYMRIVQEQTQVKYDPVKDVVIPPPAGSAYTAITPGWQQSEGAFYLDAPTSNLDAAKAKVIPGPNGFEAWDVYGASLGIYASQSEAMIAATNAVYMKGKTFVFDNDGMHITGELDGHTQFMQGVPQPQTPIEMAAQAIEQNKPQRQQSLLPNVGSELQVTQVVNDPQLMQLMEVRDDFVNDKENYRSTDGQMKKKAAADLAAIDARIKRFTELKGIPNANENEVADTAGMKLDEVANAEAKKAEAPLYPNLNPFEQKHLAKLNEKDQFEGLSAREQEEMDRLKFKAETGSDRIGIYREATKDEVSEFSEEEQKLIRRVDKKRKYSKATREILKMRGVRLAARNASPQMTMQAISPREGWTFAKSWLTEEKPTETGLIAVNQEKQSVILYNGKTFDLLRIDGKDNLYPIGTFPTLDEAVRIAEGASPAFVAEVTAALKGFWGSFNIKPRLFILTTADILDNKVNMTMDERQSLISGRGVFTEGKPGTVYINVDTHDHVEETIHTLVHEMLTHFGLRALLPVKYWDAVLTAYAVRNREMIAQIEREGKSEGSVALRSMGDDKLADILTADEAIAYTSEAEYTGKPLAPFDQKFLDRVVAQFRAWFRWAIATFTPKSWHANIFKYVPFNRKDVIFVLKDAASALRTSQQKTVDTTRHGRQHIMSAKGKEVFDRSMDSFGDVWKVKSAGLFLQAIQFAERYNLPGVADYMASVQRWAARKASLQNMPVELVQRWQLYNKRRSNRLSEALLYMTGLSDKLGHALPRTEAERKAQYPDDGKVESVESVLQKYDVDAEGASIYDEIDTSFKKTLDYLEAGLMRQELRRHTETREQAEKLYKDYQHDLKHPGEKSQFFETLKTDPKLKNFDVAGRLNTIAAEMSKLRDRNYFPYMRFGRYAVWVRAAQDVVLDDAKYFGPRGDNRGQMVHFETFETYREAQEAYDQIAKEYGGKFKVGTGWVSDVEHSMLGMPPALYDTLKEGLTLSEEQKELLKEIYYTKSPGQRFLRSMANRKGIKGFSTDAMRVYSSYMLNAANHIARIEHGWDMDQGISEIQRAAHAGLVAGHVRDYWVKHHTYIMNPENDWAGLRAVGFMWYLGFNVKSAFVNLTQVPMVALPYLGARFGDTEAMAAVTQAYKEAFKILSGKGIATGDMEQALQRGIEEGFLDESLATILAGFSESSMLQRLVPESDAQRRINQVSWAGAFMFRHVEKLNRYVTFIAARKLALKKYGGNTEQAFMEAKEAVQSSMFEYAKWNRAPYMRGKKSVFFLFWSYMQGMAYLMAGGKGQKTAMRVWMMMLLAAGLQGIPFAENLLDLIDWSSKQMKELFGSEDPYSDARLELRKLASTITDNPDMLLHGWSRHFGLGPVHLLGLAGVPVPEVDISGSISAGRWIPGTDKLTSGERDPDKKFGQVMVDVLGPVAGVGYGLFSAVVDDNPDSWKKWERAMPSALKSASQGLRRGEREAEEFRGGGTLAKFDPNNPEDRTSLWMNMLGFQPTKVGQAYEVVGSKENLRRYWTGRHAMVMENWAFAMRSQDQELIADAREAMRDFNADVPDPALRLTPEKIRRSMKARAKRIAQREMGLPNEKGYRKLYEQIDQIYGLQST